MSLLWLVIRQLTQMEAMAAEKKVITKEEWEKRLNDVKIKGSMNKLVIISEARYRRKRRGQKCHFIKPVRWRKRNGECRKKCQVSNIRGLAQTGAWHIVAVRWCDMVLWLLLLLFVMRWCFTGTWRSSFRKTITATPERISHIYLDAYPSTDTVVCFPVMEGVIELSTIEHVLEDFSLIEHIKTSFLNNFHVNDPIKSGTTLKSRNQEDLAYVAFDNNVESIPKIGCKTSPDGSSNAFQANQQLDETFMVERITSGTSQVQS
ncbi:hypothetical protein V8G54_023231 [Vigna mungo]|uniref:Transcription factor MYC/MYB N-terminal domain-containing protein n=1 Tax=Vigna mungo TaxID=3915 RepID=A0AAQ3N4S5_VIGMU